MVPRSATLYRLVPPRDNVTMGVVRPGGSQVRRTEAGKGLSRGLATSSNGDAVEILLSSDKAIADVTRVCRRWVNTEHFSPLETATP